MAGVWSGGGDVMVILVERCGVVVVLVEWDGFGGYLIPLRYLECVKGVWMKSGLSVE